ncbi:hypothetical protein SPBRAN_1482 [uncultured Candidatus Thioglobus sp.]|nr:hypothetical protein SPBRAN_1482 [uncultured Candidatus Thioglobus sp.]
MFRETEAYNIHGNQVESNFTITQISKLKKKNSYLPTQKFALCHPEQAIF